MAEGLFKVVYQGSSAPAGGYNLTLDLAVDTAHNVATGRATVTQATNPPLEVVLPVRGIVTDMTVMNPTQTYHLVTLESPNLPGRHIDVRLVTAPDWKSGTAAVTLFLDTPDGLKQFVAQVKAVG